MTAEQPEEQPVFLLLEGNQRDSAPHSQGAAEEGQRVPAAPRCMEGGQRVLAAPRCVERGQRVLAAPRCIEGGQRVLAAPRCAERGQRVLAAPRCAERGQRVLAAPRCAEGGQRVPAAPRCMERGQRVPAALWCAEGGQRVPAALWCVERGQRGAWGVRRCRVCTAPLRLQRIFLRGKMRPRLPCFERLAIHIQYIIQILGPVIPFRFDMSCNLICSGDGEAVLCTKQLAVRFMVIDKYLGESDGAPELPVKVANFPVPFKAATVHQVLEVASNMTTPLEVRMSTYK